jgi:hypothetical protein
MRDRLATIDAARGEARIGHRVIAVAAAGPRGELRIDEGGSGTVLRPLSFGERGRILARTLCTAEPLEETCAGILAGSLVRVGGGESAIIEILALLLAGAGEAALPFAATMSVVARATGWDYAQLAEAEAMEVDRLAMQLAEAKAESDWNRLILAAQPAVELMAIRAVLAGNLLARAEAVPEADLFAVPERMGNAMHPEAAPEADLFAMPERMGNAMRQSICNECEEPHSVVGSGIANEERPAELAANYSPKVECEGTVIPVPVTPAVRTSVGGRALAPRQIRLREGSGFPPCVEQRLSEPSAPANCTPLVSRLLALPLERTSPAATKSRGWTDPSFHATPPDSLRSTHGSRPAFASSAPEIHAAHSSASTNETGHPHSTNLLSAPGLNLPDSLAALLNEEADLRGIDR